MRTKVAVVLLLPAAVALGLGGLRVQSQLDGASRLSTVLDQLSVVRDSVALSDLVTNEMMAAVAKGTPGAPNLSAVKSAVDEKASAIRQAAEVTKLPADQVRLLNAALGRLNTLRQQSGGTDANPIAEIAGYLEVANSLGDLVPGVVGVADVDELDKTARSITALQRLRAILATEQILLRFGAAAAGDPAFAAAAQRVAAEESILAGQVQRDIPAANSGAFGSATKSAQARRDALQGLVTAGGNAAALVGLLPELINESTALDGLRGELLTTLADAAATHTNQARADALRDAAIVLGTLLAALVIALLVARTLIAPMRTLRSAALKAARHQLPETVERVRAGEQVDWRSVEPVPVQTAEEVGQLARAFDDMHQQAVRLAGEQAELRRQVSDMFTTLARRSQSMVELQLEVIEELESDEQDPRRLDGLFRLDHLATRLRRNGENLQVLAGGTPARHGQEPVNVVELLRAAVSEVNDYRRVAVGHAPAAAVRGTAAADVVHILAELLENATRFSSPQRKVVLTADRGADGGLLIEVVDAGLGMAPEDLEAANRRLSATDVVGPETTRRMGLFVVSRLAQRHGVTVRLRPTYESTTQSGITASVHVPAVLVVADTTPGVERGPVPEGPARNWFVAMTKVDTVNTVGTVDTVNTGVDSSAPAKPAQPLVTIGRVRPTPEPAPVPGPVAEPSPRPVGTTASGLPQRRPGGRMVTVEPAGDPVPEPAVTGAGFRDPETIRSNLSRHYDGMRAARQHTNTEPEAREGQ